MSIDGNSPEKGHDADAPTQNQPEPTFVGNHDGEPDLWVPPRFAKALGLEIGDSAEIALRGDKIVIRESFDRSENDDARWSMSSRRDAEQDGA